MNMREVVARLKECLVCVESGEEFQDSNLPKDWKRGYLAGYNSVILSLEQACEKDEVISDSADK
mgnify:CR=1 FL=1